MSKTRMTKQRATILAALRNVTSHPTADELYGMAREQIPSISLGTVYRNLDLLTDAGEIQCLDKMGGQKHFDGNAKPHHHVQCRTCGRIGDVVLPASSPSAFQNAFAPGFAIQEVSLQFVGICHSCEKSNRASQSETE